MDVGSKQIRCVMGSTHKYAWPRILSYDAESGMRKEGSYISGIETTLPTCVLVPRDHWRCRPGFVPETKQMAPFPFCI